MHAYAYIYKIFISLYYAKGRLHTSRGKHKAKIKGLWLGFLGKINVRSPRKNFLFHLDELLFRELLCAIA